MPGFLENAVKLLELIKDLSGMTKWLIWRPVIVANLEEPDTNGQFCLDISKMHKWGKAVRCRVFLDRITDEKGRRRAEVGIPVELWPGPVRLFGIQHFPFPIFVGAIGQNGQPVIGLTKVIGDKISGKNLMGLVDIGLLGQELFLTVRIVFCTDDDALTELTDEVLRIAVRRNNAILNVWKYSWALLSPEKEVGEIPRSVNRLFGVPPSKP